MSYIGRGVDAISNVEKLDNITFDDAKTKRETDKSSGNQKLKDLGLTDDEITAVTGN